MSSNKRLAAAVSKSSPLSSSFSSERSIDAEAAPQDLNNLRQEIFLKILVLGDLGVGKTALVRKYTGEVDDKLDYKVSTYPDYRFKQVELEGKLVHIQLWDIPSHERFGGMTRVHYKYSHGALIVFDLSRPETFDSALSWLSDVTEKLFDEKQRLLIGGAEDPVRLAGTDANSAMPILLLANKCDVPDVKVSRQKYSSYVRQNGLLGWYETSARDLHSDVVSLAVRRLVEYILATDPTVKVAKENVTVWKSSRK